MKKTKQTVTVKPVLLPGAKDETTWDQDRTHQLNYEHLGIVNDPNKIGKTGRNSSKLEALEEGETEAAAAKRRRDEDTSVAAQATVGGDEVRGLLGQVRSTGLAPPKRLTTKQRRIVGALVVRPNADQAPPTHPVTAAFALPSPRARHPSSFPKNVAAHPRTLEPSNPPTLQPSHPRTRQPPRTGETRRKSHRHVARPYAQRHAAHRRAASRTRGVVRGVSGSPRGRRRARLQSAHENLAQGQKQSSMMSTHRDARIFSRRGRQPVTPCNTTPSRLTRLVAVVALLYPRDTRLRFSRPRRSPSAAAAAPSASAPSSISTASRVSASHVRL